MSTAKNSKIYEELRRKQVDRAITEVPKTHLTDEEVADKNRVQSIHEISDLDEQRQDGSAVSGLANMPDSDLARRAAAYARDEAHRAPAEKPPGTPDYRASESDEEDEERG